MKGQKGRQNQKADKNFSKNDKAGFLDAASSKAAGNKTNIILII